MATSNLPIPTLQPVSDLAAVDSTLIATIDDGASCCGGGCCSTN